MYENLIIKNLIKITKEEGEYEKLIKILEFGLFNTDEISKKIFINGLRNITKDKELKNLKKLKKEIYKHKQKSLF